MTHSPKEYLIQVGDDGLQAPLVGPWAAEKYRRLGMYAELFSTGMKNRWDCRVYLDLFAGPGHAVIRGERGRVLTSPLLALTVPDPFDKYSYCDREAAKLDSLRRRVTCLAPNTSVEYVVGDANERVDEIQKLIPNHSRSHRVLSFCFVDPFGLDIHFETIRCLGAERSVDFLILLALGMDATRNWQTYLRPGNSKVEKFLGAADWRPRWQEALSQGKTGIRFLADEYAAPMTRLGYLTPGLDRMIEVRTHDNNMRLYYLAFFSKNELGYKFWDEARKYSSDQLRLAL